VTERVLKLFLRNISLNHSFLVRNKKKDKKAIQIQKKLCFTCNDTGEIISFCLTGANVIKVTSFGVLISYPELKYVITKTSDP